MSVVKNQSQINNERAFFLLANMSSVNSGSISTAQITTSSIGAITGQISTLNTNLGNFSSIYTNYVSSGFAEITDIVNSTIFSLGVFINGAELTTVGGNELLLNGLPIATTTNLSSIQDWALDPAVSTVNMAGNNLISTNQISCINLVAGNILVNNLLAYNILAVSTFTSTISSLTNTTTQLFASSIGSGNITTSTISSLTAATGQLYASSIGSGNITASTIGVRGIDSLSSINGQPYPLPGTGSTISTFQTVTATQYVSTPQLFVSSINGAELTQNTIVISSLVTTFISSPLVNANLALMSSFQLAPNASFDPNLNINFGLGSAFENIAGAAAGGFSLIVGGVALATATTALYSARQTVTLKPSTFELVNTTTQLQVSTLGQQVSSIIRFVSSLNEQTPGQEIFISTVIPAGTLVIRSMSDPLNTISSPSSTIQAFGQWVALPSGGVSQFSTLTVSSLIAADNISTAQLFVGNSISTGVISLTNVFAQGLVSTLQLAASTLTVSDVISTANVNLSSINSQPYPPTQAPFSTFTNNIYVQNIVSSGAVVTTLVQNLGLISTLVLEASTIRAIDLVSTPSLIVSSINGLPVNPSTLGVSSITATDVSTININAYSFNGVPLNSPIFANPDYSTVNVTGQITASTFATNKRITCGTGQFDGNSVSTNTISTNTIRANIINVNTLSTGTLTIGNLITPSISSINISTSAIRASSILANTVSTVGTVDVGGQLTVRSVAVVNTAIYTGFILVSTISQPVGGQSLLRSTVTDTLYASTISTFGFTTSSINSIPAAAYLTPVSYTNKVLWSSLSTVYNAVASTFITTQTSNLVQINFSASAQNSVNQFHNLNYYLAIDGLSSVTAATSVPSGIGHYTSGSINYVTTVPSGSHRVVAYMNCDANAIATVTNVFLTALGNLSQG